MSHSSGAVMVFGSFSRGIMGVGEGGGRSYAHACMVRLEQLPWGREKPLHGEVTGVDYKLSCPGVLMKNHGWDGT